MGGGGCDTAYKWGGDSDASLVGGGDGGGSRVTDTWMMVLKEGLQEEDDPEEIQDCKIFTAGVGGR